MRGGESLERFIDNEDVGIWEASSLLRVGRRRQTKSTPQLLTGKLPRTRLPLWCGALRSLSRRMISLSFSFLSAWVLLNCTFASAVNFYYNSLTWLYISAVTVLLDFGSKLNQDPPGCVDLFNTQYCITHWRPSSFVLDIWKSKIWNFRGTALLILGMLASFLRMQPSYFGIRWRFLKSLKFFVKLLSGVTPCSVIYMRAEFLKCL